VREATGVVSYAVPAGQKRGRGDVAQLVEHLLCKQEVAGSSPAVSTVEG
jgi:hypothetical protein